MSGLEKYELLAKQAGNDDPFFLKAVQRSKGTKDSPTIIHAMDNYRMVGCVCNEEDTNIKWTWLCEVRMLTSFTCTSVKPTLTFEIAKIWDNSGPGLLVLSDPHLKRNE